MVKLIHTKELHL